MKLQKLYFKRNYNQWKGLDIAIEEEVNGHGLYIQVPDLEVKKGSATITADFGDKNFKNIAIITCSIEDEKRRIIRVEVPKIILSNDGLYSLSFSIDYNTKGTKAKIEKTAVQTFTILDTIEFSEEDIISDDRYNILTELIKEVKEEELDVSIFAKKEYVEKLIEEALNGVDMDTIIAELEARGIYITSEELEERIGRLINEFDSSTGFLRKSKLVSELLRLEYINKEILDERMKNYTTTAKLESSYVKKENGKELISTILIDKLKNIPEEGYYDDTELRNLIDKRVTHEYLKETIKNLNTIKKEDYYDKTIINDYIDDIYDMHNNSISDLEEGITNIENNIDNIEESYLKKEDYQYADGIQTDDVMLNEKTLTEILTELTYKEIEIKKFNTTLISHLYEFRADKLTSITLQWELSRNPISQSINIYSGNISVDTREITIPIEISANTDVTLTVVDEKGVEKKSIIPIKFVFPSYYGTYENTLSADNIRNGNKIIMDNKNTTINMNYTNSKIFFAYPKVFGELVDIKDNNGLSYFNDFIYNGTDYATGGTSYNVYMLDEKATCKNISYSLIFKKEEE